ncbi:hypothetical protein LWI29_007556 [Acer saccharum]|uniref:Uncharacterized protein n=1 Tax=Acer saccharum TaxID=4024 RepID=A0AA39RKI7_ACESA|nr:hypothetical protein LWI29_007556 [Acer saccharum]
MLPDEYKVSSFQEGLSPHTQLLITNACGGSTADKTAAFVMDVCERLVLMSQQCNFSTRANGRHEVGMGTETAIEVSKLAKQMQSMQAIMLSMQSFMTNQGSASHIQGRDGSGDMSFNGEGCDGFQEEVRAMGYQQRDRGGVYSQPYNQKWRGHPNLSYSNNNALNSDLLSQEVNQGYNNNRGFYQGQGSGSGQANQWSRQENFNNQARQQVEPILPDGQRLKLLGAVDCFTVDVIESGKLPNSPNDYLDELLAILDEEEEVHVKEAPKDVDELRSQKMELMLERDLLKKEKILLQKKMTETVQEKEEMREDFERKMQVMKGELEGKDNALKIIRLQEYGSVELQWKWEDGQFNPKAVFFLSVTVKETLKTLAEKICSQFGLNSDEVDFKISTRIDGSIVEMIYDLDLQIFISHNKENPKCYVSVFHKQYEAWLTS